MASGKGEENINLDIVIYGEVLEQVRSFKYLGSTITENGTSDQEIKNRIRIATSVMTKLDIVWSLRGISLKNRIKITKAIRWATLLYDCESWTLSQKYVDKLKAFEMRCYRRMLKITWKERRTNEYVWNKVTEILGERPEPVMGVIMMRKLKYFGHRVRRNGMARALIEGNVEGERGRGRPRRQWKDDLKQWTGRGLGELGKLAENREEWRFNVRRSVQQRP